MKKKGFTLVELLAVIVILAIIALIATPIVLGVIENARKGSIENSALGYIDAVEKQAAINLLNSNAEDNINDGVYTISELDSKNVKVKGQKPSEGWVQLTKGSVSNYSLKIGEYVVNPDTNNKNIAVATKNGEVAAQPTSGSSEPVGQSGPTKVEAGESDTHKGIVYLDPTDLTAECDANNSNEGIGTSGCMKFYIYDDSGDTYKMILDHNTANGVQWNASNINVAYESSGAYTSIQKLNWNSSLNTTLITTSDINAITGKTDFDSTNRNSWYYFDDPSKGQTRTATSQGASSYAWLYDYTSGCTTYGCNREGSVDYGYWTQDSVGTAGSGSYVWTVNRNGNLGRGNADISSGGVRPVISVSKGLFS